MARWHELLVDHWALVVPSKDRKSELVVQHSKENPQLCQAHFRRWIGSGVQPFHRWASPSDWEEWWPTSPVLGDDFQVVKRQAMPLFPQVQSGVRDSSFTVLPYRPPDKPERVGRVFHPTVEAEALVLKHSESKYEIRCFITDAQLREGWRMRPPGWPRERLPKGKLPYSFADSLPEAEQTAVVELDAVIREYLEAGGTLVYRTDSSLSPDADFV